MTEQTTAPRPRRRWGGRVAMLAAALGLGLAGALATGGVAHAGTTCGSGDACIFAGSPYGAHTFLYSNGSHANPWVTIPSNGGYVWNNGTYYPGYDSIELIVSRAPGQTRARICLNYGAFDATSQAPTAAYLNPGDQVQEWVWRAHCHPEFNDDIFVNF